jgi:PPM family protein phosphatase
MIIRASGLSDVGKLREDNEDSFGIFNFSEGNSTPYKAMIVADGVGGHNAGEVASQKAVEIFAELLQKYVHNEMSPGRFLHEIIIKVNSAIFNFKRKNAEYERMCTTLSALIIAPNMKYFIGHVGDSRVYLYRDKELSLLTRDHSAVQDAVDEGKITAKEAENHPDRSMITQAIGYQETVQVEIKSSYIKSNDIFLLCSDGLSTYVARGDIENSLKKKKPPNVLCKDLIKKANYAGGKDNITVIVALIYDPSEKKKSLFRRIPIIRNYFPDTISDDEAPKTVFKSEDKSQ